MKASRSRRSITSFLNKNEVYFVARLILGGAFLYAGLLKIVSSNEFARIVLNYGILPENVAVYFAFILPWVELMLGVFLIIGFQVRKTALALSFLLAVFAVAVVIRYLKVGLADCGCFSMNSSGSESILSVIGRDTAFLACCAYIIASERKWLAHKGDF
jgi:putative oxidoreductase